MIQDDSLPKKRILIVCQHFWPESFRINDITEYLLNEGYDIDVLCGRPNYPSGRLTKGYTLWNRRKEDYKGATVHRVFEIPRGNNSNLRIFINYISFPIASLFHVPKLLTKKYDKILLYQLSPVMMSIAGILVGKIKKVETTMYVLDLWPENLYSVLSFKSLILRRLIGAVSVWHYKKADKLVALSEKMKQQLVERTGKPGHLIEILPQAAESVYETPVIDKNIEQKYKKTFNVLFTGNISPAQSFHTMIDAAEILRNEGLNDVRWVIVGDGMSKRKVQSQIQSRGLQDLFVFEGHKPVADIPKYTYVADVLVGCLVKSPLLEATIPAKVMSYIAAGKPIVLAMDGEARTLINNKVRCGFAGKTEDADTLAANIKKVYALTPEQREKMGDLAHNYHFKHFERNLILAKLSRFIFT